MVKLYNILLLHIWVYQICFLKHWHFIGKYPHTFHNGPRSRKYGPPSPPIDFPNQGTEPGELLDFPALRSPRGEIFGPTTNPLLNPDRVVFRMDIEGIVTFMGLMSHAGNLDQGFQKR